MGDADDENFAALIDVDLLDSDTKAASFNKCPWNNPNVHSSVAMTDMEISDTQPLGQHSSTAREPCTVCRRPKKFFCSACCRPLESSRPFIPVVARIPVPVDIIKHAHELDGKSTSSHAKILCPSHVRMFTHPNVPDYSKEKVFMLYPDETARTIPNVGMHEIDRLVVVDSTWSQARGVLQHERLRGLPRIRLAKYKTMFWRGQSGKSDDHLATIEAIYYFQREFHSHHLPSPYRGEYDNLLFLFKFMHDRIHT